MTCKSFLAVKHCSPNAEDFDSGHLPCVPSSELWECCESSGAPLRSLNKYMQQWAVNQAPIISAYFLCLGAFFKQETDMKVQEPVNWPR